MHRDIRASLISSLALQAVLANQYCGGPVSLEGRFVVQSEFDIQSRTEASVALFGEKEQVMSTIYETAVDCRIADWDGYGALPLSSKSVAYGIQFVRLLPDNTPMPEVSPEPDGMLALDWAASKSRRLSVSFCDSERIAYAWLDGSDRGHATARFDGQAIPQRVLDAINAIMV